MAELTDDQLTYLHVHVGAAVSDDELFERYERLGDVDEVVLETLRQQLSSLVATPAQFSVAGEYSQNTAENIKALQAKLTSFTAESSSSGGLSVVTVVSPLRSRSR